MAFKLSLLLTIDKVNIDGLCLLLKRRPIDKLLAKHFFVIRKFLGLFVLKNLNMEILGPNRTK